MTASGCASVRQGVVQRPAWPWLAGVAHHASMILLNDTTDCSDPSTSTTRTVRRFW
ncbi:hypothetical protein [Dictyobacter formicarum]|uniref:hypothetical protein n=1 Tax=Dictyobacter formicarum TaxID=2778368 RepID=UPI0019164390|nr:hypothetical protein [Dictyobacter formicarum]